MIEQTIKPIEQKLTTSSGIDIVYITTIFIFKDSTLSKYLYICPKCSSKYFIYNNQNKETYLVSSCIPLCCCNCNRILLINKEAINEPQKGILITI